MKASHPLSSAQAPFWSGQKLVGEAPLYNMAWRFDLHLELDPDLFARAFQDVARGSDAMSARFFEDSGAPRQKVGDILAFPDVLIVTAEEVPAVLDSMVATPFDLTQTSYRTRLVQVAQDHWVWIFVQHHIACDAQAGAVLVRRVSERYEALSVDDEAPNPVQPSFFDAIAPTSHTSRPSKLLGSFPYGATRGTDPNSTRVSVPFDATALNALAESTAFRLFTPELSRYALYLTAYAAFLARVTGDETITIGTPSHNRLNELDRATLGLFVEVLPIEVEVYQADSFRSLHSKVKDALGSFLRAAKPGAIAHSDKLGFSNIMNYIQAKFEGFAGAPMEAKWIHSGAHDARHALRLHVTDFTATGEADLSFDITSTVLVETTAKDVADHFSTFATAALADVEAPLDHLPLGGARLSEVSGSPQAETPCVLDSFLAHTDKTPDVIALEHSTETLSYAQLRDRAARLATTLAQSGVRPGQAVALHMPRSIDYVIGIFATLMTGAHFVPIAISNPAARTKDIIARASAVAILTDPARVSMFSDMHLPVLTAEAQAAPLEPKTPAPSDTAYLIFTSGSTGVPKGVAVSHDGLARYISWAASEFGGPDYPLFTSISFDLTITSLFVPLTNGGRVVVYDEPTAGPDLAVLDVFAQDCVDTVKLTPGHLSLVCQAGKATRRIKTLVLGGENLSVGLCRKAQDVLGPVRILNEYGPTEAVVGCMIQEFDPNNDTGPSVPIGKPAAGVTIGLRDAGLNLVPRGVVGEICISGRIAKGYSDPKLNTEKFVAKQPRMYRSGDLGRLRANGVIEYLGRADMQIKQGGVRIEPAEIETALLGIPSVVAAYVGHPSQPTDIQNCAQCGLPSNYPGTSFNDEGLCQICSQFDAYKDRAQAYFAPPAELSAKIEKAKANRSGKYDVIMLLSGGKDSTYAAYRLAELTPKVLALTLNNGFLSDEAMQNIESVTEHLGWDHQFMTTPAMNEIFVDSLKRHSNVCQGCFKTVYTLALREARAQGVPAIVTGLSRGQFFETRLTPELFQQKAPSKDDLERMVMDARRRYHAEDDAIASHLDTRDIQNGNVLAEVEIIDLYRYIDVPVSEIYRYLNANGTWKRPSDTGRSTNCLINDLGIYFHRKREGFHNYALPYSWDVRMGHKTREEALDELNDEIDVQRVEKMLAQIGFDDPIERDDLIAYVTTTADEAEIWDGLRGRLPSEMLPSGVVVMDQIPLTPNGKVDKTKLERRRVGARPTQTEFVPPQTGTEKALALVIGSVLALPQVGRHEDFFDLGADSLAAVKIAMAANEIGYALPTAALFDHRNLAGLAAYADQLDKIEPQAEDQALLDLDTLDLSDIADALK